MSESQTESRSRLAGASQEATREAEAPGTEPHAVATPHEAERLERRTETATEQGPALSSRSTTREASTMQEKAYTELYTVELTTRVGMAGWGVPSPCGGDYLSDGYDSADDALWAARYALDEIRLHGVTLDLACERAAQEHERRQAAADREARMGLNEER